MGHDKEDMLLLRTDNNIDNEVQACDLVSLQVPLLGDECTVIDGFIYVLRAALQRAHCLIAPRHWLADD